MCEVSVDLSGQPQIYYPPSIMTVLCCTCQAHQSCFCLCPWPCHRNTWSLSMLRHTSVWVLGTLIQSLMLARQALYTLSHLPFCPRLPYCHTHPRHPGKGWAPYHGSLECSAIGTSLPFPQCLSVELCLLDQIIRDRICIFSLSLLLSSWLPGFLVQPFGLYLHGC